MSKLFPILIILSFFLFAVSAFSKTVSVKYETTYLMSGPGNNFGIKWKYDKGFPLKVLSIKGKWVKVEDFEKEQGWVFGDSLSSKNSVIVKVETKTNGRVNIHTGPGLNYRVIGKAFYGVVFYKEGQKGGWTKVQHESGLVGWIKSTLLWGNK